MKLEVSNKLPIITFNGRKVFKGKARFIKSIKELGRLKLSNYSFESNSNEFDVKEALVLIKPYISSF